MNINNIDILLNAGNGRSKHRSLPEREGHRLRAFLGLVTKVLQYEVAESAPRSRYAEIVVGIPGKSRYLKQKRGANSTQAGWNRGSNNLSSLKLEMEGLFVWGREIKWREKVCLML